MSIVANMFIALVQFAILDEIAHSGTKSPLDHFLGSFIHLFVQLIICSPIKCQIMASNEVPL